MTIKFPIFHTMFPRLVTKFPIDPTLSRTFETSQQPTTQCGNPRFFLAEKVWNSHTVNHTFSKYSQVTLPTKGVFKTHCSLNYWGRTKPMRFLFSSVNILRRNLTKIIYHESEIMELLFSFLLYLLLTYINLMWPQKEIFGIF